MGMLRPITNMPLSELELEVAGKPIGWNELWVAAHALAIGSALVAASIGSFRRLHGSCVENGIGCYLGVLLPLLRLGFRFRQDLDLE